MFNKITSLNNHLFSSLLISFFPVSFILGNSAINLNIFLIILYSIFVFFSKRENTDINFIFIDKLIIIFLFYISFVTFLNYLKLPDGDQSDQLIIKSVSYIRYFIFYFALRFLINKNFFDYRFFLLSSSICVIFVSLDIVFQYNFGRDIFGFEAVPRRMAGPFGDELIAGGYLSRFALFLIFLFFIFKNLKNIQFKIRFPLYIITSTILSFGLILAGNRVPFLIFLVMVFLCFVLFKNFRIFFISFFLISICSLITLIKFDEGVKKHYGAFQTKIINFVQPFSEDKKIKNEDLGNLTKVEKKYTFTYKGEVFIAPTVHAKEFYTGFKTWNENKFFGGGIKSFRYNCPKVFVNCNNHPHNYYLEILTDLGLLGFFIIISLFAYVFYKAYISKKIILIPFWIILFGEVFPLKTTGSFFSTSNSTFIFLFLSLIVSMLGRKDLN